MKVFITGGTGTLGKKVVEMCLLKGWSVFILTRNTSTAESEGVQYIIGDILDSEKLGDAVSGMDAVIHLAGITHTFEEKKYYEVNTQGTKNMLRACEKNNVPKFLFVSTRTAHQNGGAYAQSKLLAEDAVKESRIPWVIIRPSEVYGGSNREGITKLIALARKGNILPIIGNGQYDISPVFIDDVAHGILKAVASENALYKTYVLAGPNRYTYRELVDFLGLHFQKKSLKIYIPVALAKIIARIFVFFRIGAFVPDQIPRLLCPKEWDISQSRQDLGFDPIPFEEGLKKLLL